MRRPIAVSAAIAVIAFALVGCSAASTHHASTTAKSSGLDCAGFLKLSSSARTTEAASLASPPVTFNSTGTASQSPVEYYTSACKSSSKAETMTDVAGSITQTYPSCTDFLASAVQAAWVTGYWKTKTFYSGYSSDPTDEVNALVRGCKTSNVADPTIDDAEKQIAIYIYNNQPSETQLAAYLAGDVGASAPTQAALKLTWTSTTTSGYSVVSTATWGSPQRGTASTKHPEDASFALSAACQFNPSTDAYIAGVLTATNTTTGFSFPLATSMSVQGTPTHASVDAELDDYASDRAYCGGNTAATFFSVDSSGTVGPGKSISDPFFVVLHNYYSPSFPSGDSADLATFKLVEAAAGPASQSLG